MSKPIECTYETEIKTDLRIALRGLIADFPQGEDLEYEVQARYISNGLGYTGSIHRTKIIRTKEQGLWGMKENVERKQKKIFAISLRAYNTQEGELNKYITAKIYHKDFALGKDFYCSRLQKIANVWGAYKIEVTESY